jgi:hypothetical protein
MFGNVSLPKKVDSPIGHKGPKALFTNPQTNQPAPKSVAFQGFELLKQAAFNKIYQHELAHQQAGGSQAGNININYDGNGVAQSGHVNISFPKAVNKANPGESKKQAQVAYNAAMAPGDPSGQDMAVASMAQSIIGQAEMAMNKKKVEGSKGQTLNLIG